MARILKFTTSLGAEITQSYTDAELCALWPEQDRATLARGGSLVSRAKPGPLERLGDVTITEPAAIARARVEAAKEQEADHAAR